MADEDLVDSYGRRINYLRISLTDLCNFRCIYCVAPAHSLTPHKTSVLTRPEITRFVRIIGGLGVDRIRLTGGEPLLRADILDIIRALKTVDTVRDLSLTTNGSRLEPLLGDLKAAGLDRINISLDSLDAERFRQITKSGCAKKVLNAVFSALKHGFPVKLNMVILKGLPAREIIEFVSLARDYPLEVRFLEFMPLCGEGWGPENFLPIKAVECIVREHFELTPVLPRGDDVAETYRLKQGLGSVGFIASLTRSFCDDCSRIRLSSDGTLFPCLFSDTQVSVRTLLQENAPEEAIISAIREAARLKPRGNWFADKPYKEDSDLGYAYKASPMIHDIGG